MIPANKRWVTAVLADDRFTDGEARALVRVGLVSANYTTLVLKVKQSTVAESSCVTQGTVSKAFVKAVKHGYLADLSQARCGRSRSASNEYRLAFPPDQPYSVGNTVEGEPYSAGNEPYSVGNKPYSDETPLPAETSPPNRSIKRVPEEGGENAPAPQLLDHEPPSPYCPKHEDLGDDAPPCRKCQKRREAREAWDANREEFERQQAAAAAAAKQAAIRACLRCDDDGRIETTDASGNDAVINCTHQEDNQ